MAKHHHTPPPVHDHHYGVDILASLSFLVASVALILLHKAIAIVYPYTFTVVILQGLVTIMMNAAVMIYEYYALGVKLYIFNLPELVQFLPVAGFFLVILITGFECLKYISVMTFIALRSLSCWTSYFGEITLLGRPFRWQVLPSLMIIAIGGVVYWMHDREFNLTGYMIIVANIFAQSGFALYNKWLDKKKHYSVYTMSMYSNIIAVTVVVLFAFVSGELPNEAIDGLDKLTDGQNAILWLGGAGRWLFSVTGFWCNSLFSATAFTIQSTLNRVPTILFSAWLFESHITSGMIVGSTITIMGGLAYPLTMYYLEKKEDEEEDLKYAKLAQEEDAADQADQEQGLTKPAGDSTGAGTTSDGVDITSTGGAGEHSELDTTGMDSALQPASSSVGSEGAPLLSAAPDSAAHTSVPIDSSSTSAAK